MNKKSKKPVVILVILAIVVLAAVGYGVLAYTKNAWPFGTQALVGDANSTSSAKPTVKITKLEQKDDVLTVGVKVKNGEENGHCVLMVMGKKTGIKIDDSETRKNLKDGSSFTDCLGWSVGTPDLPAGEYTVEVQFVGSQTVSTQKKITLK